MVLDIAMHETDGPVRISDISSRQGISVKYLEKLIRPLKQAGYVTSKRGPRGGHRLSRSAKDITVGEVVRLLEGELILTECAMDPSVCTIAQDCLTRRVWKEASDAMYERLDSITFSDLLKEAARSGIRVEECIPAKLKPGVKKGKRKKV